MHKIAVTGGAGFIGSHTCRKLLNQNYEVLCIDNFNDYYDYKIKEENIADLIENKNFICKKLDICNLKELDETLKNYKPDAIIHLAARAGVRPSILDPQLYIKVNIEGTINLLELARQLEVKKFVFASSSSVYGKSTKTPFKEDDVLGKPISPYATTKLAGEKFCETYNHLYQLPIVCLRFFTVYGPCGRPDMAPLLFLDAIASGKPLKKFGDGTSMRDYTYIDDVVSGIISSLHLNESFEIFNLGNNQTVSLNEFIATIEEIVGKKANIVQEGKKPGDVDITFADLSKSQQLLNYHPSTDIKTGMIKTYSWYSKKHEN